MACLIVSPTLVEHDLQYYQVLHNLSSLPYVLDTEDIRNQLIYDYCRHRLGVFQDSCHSLFKY